MDRRRDIPPEDRYGGGAGQSYRPGIARRTPPPRRDRDDYGGRSPGRPYDSRGPRRSRSPPGGFRRRSPSRDRFGPPRGDSYRARPRSPPREDLFRRDYRDDRPRDYGRASPRFRDRSPFRRSPPRRDRSPRRFDSRPHSPVRRPPSPRPERDFPSRPRSPLTRAEREERMDWQRIRSPPRPESGATSRRSSPPVHASRLALVQDAEETQFGKPSPRAVATPEQRRIESPRRDRDGDIGMTNAPVQERQKTPEALPERAPPSGPSERPFVPPAGPRGDVARGGFSGRGRGYGDYPQQGRSSITATFRGGRGGASFARGQSYERENFPAPAPAAPRNFSGPPPRPAPSRAVSTTSQFDGPAHDAPRAPSISVQHETFRRPPTGPAAAPTGPASDRIARPVSDGIHSALRDLPEIIPNGKKLPPVADTTRLQKLEEEAERLRKIVQEKDARKRKGLREWERLVREGEAAAYRSEVAETSVRAFDGDGERAGAAF